MADTTKKLTDTILKSILTPVIYMVEFEDAFEFVCFCDRSILINEIYKTEAELTKILGKQAIILDIRELPEADRIEIVKEGEILFYEDEIIKQLFEISMFEDFKLFLDRRNSALDRVKTMGTPYFS